MKEIFKLTFANRTTKLLDNLGLAFNNISLLCYSHQMDIN